jgi:hypothetical protein
LFVLQSVAAAFEDEHVGVVDEPVDHGFDRDDIPEDLGPSREALVGGHDERGLLVAGGDELEEQRGGDRIEGDVANFADTSLACE